MELMDDTPLKRTARRLAIGLALLVLVSLCGGQSAAGQDSAESLFPSFTGTVHAFNGRILTLEMEDSNQMDFHCSRKTRYLDGKKKVRPSAIRRGMMVTVEGKPAPDASMDAVVVRLEHTPAPAGTDNRSTAALMGVQ